MLKLKSRRPVWSSAVFLQQELTIPPNAPADILVSCRSGMRWPTSPHTKADPFLFEHRGRLFLFFETQVLDNPGRIEVAEIMAGGAGELEPVLEEPFHLSYPHVFEMGGDIFMLPETSASGEVRLYKFERFPQVLRFERTLLTGTYTDPSPVLVDGIWYLFLTSARGLELFYTADLLHEQLCEHPLSPITAHPAYCRSAGVPFYHRGELIRPAQDCSGRYGGDVNLVRIDAISPREYRETPMVDGLLSRDQPWNDLGGHHLSICRRSDGSHAVALDGQAADSIVNKIIARLWRKISGAAPGQ